MVTLESEWLKLMSCGDGSWVTHTQASWVRVLLGRVWVGL